MLLHNEETKDDGQGSGQDINLLQLKLGGIALTRSEAIALCNLNFEDLKSFNQKINQKLALDLLHNNAYLRSLRRRYKNLLDFEIDKEKTEQNIQVLQSQVKALKKENAATNSEIQKNNELTKQTSNKLISEQQIIAYKLAYIFETGDPKKISTTKSFYLNNNGIYGDGPIAIDEWKASQYLTQATGAENVKPNTKNTTDVYDGFGWFTSIRLFTVRLNRVLDESPHLSSIPKAFPKVNPFQYFGLSYGLELLFDLSILTKTFVHAFKESYKSFKEEGQSWSEALVSAFRPAKTKLVEAYHKDGRASRMFNAAVWFTCNMIGLFSPLSLLYTTANIVTFSFDVLNEVYRAHFELKKYEQLQEKIDDQIKSLSKKLEDPSSHKETLTNELRNLSLVKHTLSEKIESIRKDRKWIIVFSLGILAGMVLFFFPPAFLPYAALIGAGIAFGCGSLFLGLGKRLSSKFNRRSSTDKTVSKIENSHNNQQEITNTPAPAPIIKSSMIQRSLNSNADDMKNDSRRTFGITNKNTENFSVANITNTLRERNKPFSAKVYALSDEEKSHLSQAGFDSNRFKTWISKKNWNNVLFPTHSSAFESTARHNELVSAPSSTSEHASQSTVQPAVVSDDLNKSLNTRRRSDSTAARV